MSEPLPGYNDWKLDNGPHEDNCEPIGDGDGHIELEVIPGGVRLRLVFDDAPIVPADYQPGGRRFPGGRRLLADKPKVPYENLDEEEADDEPEEEADQ